MELSKRIRTRSRSGGTARQWGDKEKEEKEEDPYADAIRARQLDSTSFVIGNDDFAGRIALHLDAASFNDGTIEVTWRVENTPIRGSGIIFDPVVETRVDGQQIHRRGALLGGDGEVDLTIDEVGFAATEHTVEVVIVGDRSSGSFQPVTDMIDASTGQELTEQDATVSTTLLGSPDDDGGDSGGGGGSETGQQMSERGRRIAAAAVGGAAVWWIFLR